MKNSLILVYQIKILYDVRRLAIYCHMNQFFVVVVVFYILKLDSPCTILNIIEKSGQKATRRANE